MRLIVDAQGIAWANAHKLRYSAGAGSAKPRDLSAAGKPTGAVFGTLRTLEHLARRLEPSEMIVCWDRRCDRRFELYPDYKRHRQDENLAAEDRAFRRSVLGQIREVQHLLRYFPVIQIEEPGFEADDCIAVLCKFLQHERVGIVTGDKDLYQLATDPSVEPAHTIHKMDGSEVELEFMPRQYLIYKVLVGDPSDHISGVAGVGDKTCRKLIREFGTLEKIRQHVKQQGKLGRDDAASVDRIISRNLQLMIPGLLMTDDERKRVLNRYKLGRLDCRIAPSSELRKAFVHYKFASLVSRVSSYVATFSPLIRTRSGQMEPSPKRWEPFNENHPANRADQVRAKDHQQMRQRSRIIRKTTSHQRQRPRRRRTGHTRIVRRTVSADNAGVDPALLADTRWAVHNGSVATLPAGHGDNGDRSGQKQAVGSERAGEPDPDRIPSQGTAGPGDPDRAARWAQRRVTTLGYLMALANDPQWPAGQSLRVLAFLRVLIKQFEADPGFVPTPQAAAWVRELHDEWSYKMPGWAAIPADKDGDY